MLQKCKHTEPVAGCVTQGSPEEQRAQVFTCLGLVIIVTFQTWTLDLAVNAWLEMPASWHPPWSTWLDPSSTRFQFPAVVTLGSRR